MDKLLVSVMMPVYNADPALLERALGSVFNQTLNDWELILVDDGSSNGCIDRVSDKFRSDTRLKTIRQENQGILGAINTGINEARGEFFYIIAQDDYMHLQTLEYCVRTLERRGADLCIFNGFRQTTPDVPEHYDLGDFESIPSQTFSATDMYGQAACYGECLRRLNGDAWGHFVRTGLVKEVHKIWPLYESNARLHLMMRMARKWISSEAALYYYNVSNPASLSRKPITAKCVKRASLDFEALCEMYGKERLDPAARPVWTAVEKWCILRGAKILVNSFRRYNGGGDRTSNRECLEAFAQMLWVLKVRGALSVSKINLRLYLIYWWMMIRYGKPESRKPTADLLNGRRFTDFRFTNDHLS